MGTAISFTLPCLGLDQTASLTTLHSFVGPTNGVSPRAALVRGSDGNFYGTTQGGGPAQQGSIFVLTPTGALTTLYTFSASSGTANSNAINADGASPTASLIQGQDGNFYGTAQTGGIYGNGTVFSITAGGTLTTLHSFNYSDGGYPSAALLQAADGKLYGVTQGGGLYGSGTVFAITSAGVLTTLYNFTNADGQSPQGALVQGSDGNFYGALSQGGPSNSGAVYMVTPAGKLTILYSFTGRMPDGANPLAALVQGQDGNFYGTTSQGGANNQGTVFKITPGGTLTTLYSFTGYAGDGMSPNSPLIQTSDGAFCGTTINTAFKITPGGVFSLLANLGGNNGGPGQTGAGLVPGTDGNLYGTLPYTYSNNGGTVYTITPVGVLTTLYTFDYGGSEGTGARSKLTQNSDGNFYGTSSTGGPLQEGTVFAMTPAGTLKTLHNFGTGVGGNQPWAGLTQARDGKFYGTTFYGNTVFSITSGGTFATFYSFPSSGSGGMYPQAAIIQGSDGNFYGTTFEGGTIGNGTVFKLSPNATLTTLHSFSGSFRGGSSDGSSPYAALTQGSDGNFYGMTPSGGTAGNGTVFVITPTGVYKTLHSFTGNLNGDTGGNNDGAEPYNELVQGSEGNFYGTTSQGGTYTKGTVFVITPAGVLTILHNFSGNGTDGSFPNASLVLGSDGNFYGTAGGGGIYGRGIAFMMTPAGVFTTLYNFAGRDGTGPSSPLVQASDGNFYGTTYTGGLYNLGTVYRLTPGGTSSTATPSPDAQITCVHPSSLNQGDNGDIFSLTVANVGSVGTNGTATVTVTPGQGLNIAAMGGPGWTCNPTDGSDNSWVCTRADTLASGHYYPALTASVNVSPNATAQGGSFASHVVTAGDVNPVNDYSNDTFAVNTASSTPAQQWRYQYFGTTANSGVAADTYIYAGDGLSNLLKYALNLNPKVPAVSPLTMDLSTGYLRLTVPRNPNATDVTFSVEVNNTDLTNPGAWTSASTVVDQNTASLLQVHDSVPAVQSAEQFIRLRVTR